MAKIADEAQDHFNRMFGLLQDNATFSISFTNVINLAKAVQGVADGLNKIEDLEKNQFEFKGIIEGADNGKHTDNKKTSGHAKKATGRNRQKKG